MSLLSEVAMVNVKEDKTVLMCPCTKDIGSLILLERSHQVKYMHWTTKSPMKDRSIWVTEAGQLTPSPITAISDAIASEIPYMYFNQLKYM